MNNQIIIVLKQLLSVMEMQEKRETEQFHIRQETMKQIWDEAKEDAKKLIEKLSKPATR